MKRSVELVIAEENLNRARTEKFQAHKNLLRVYPPFWCEDGSDESYTYFDEYEFLLKHGHVVWGAVVQANKYLWNPSDVMVGATMIYSHQGVDDTNLRTLRETASRLAALKRSPPAIDQNERRYQKMLIDERERALGLPVPTTLADGLPAINTITMSPRTHMDGQMLGLTHFPVLVHPEKLTAVIIPSVFWSDAFRQEWNARVRPPSLEEIEESFAPRGAWARFRIGMGSAFNPSNLFWLLASVAIITLATPAFLYDMRRTPTVVSTLDELRNTPSDTFVEVQSPLDTKNKLANRIARKDFWLMPFLDSGYRLILARPKSKHDNSSYNPAKPHNEVVRGRLVKDSEGFDWRPGFRNFTVIGAFRSRGVTVPRDYLLIDESAQPSYLRASIYGGLMLIMLIFPVEFLIRVYRTHRLLKHDDRELLNKLWWQRKCLKEEDPEDYDM